MKKTILLHRIFTGLLCALMLLSSIPNILSTDESIQMVSTHLGYPTYLIPFIGAAKLLAVLALLVPGLPRLKEWAYAGLSFDLIGAVYSSISVGDPLSTWIFIFVGLFLIAASYIYYHKKQKQITPQEHQQIVALQA